MDIQLKNISISSGIDVESRSSILYCSISLLSSQIIDGSRPVLNPISFCHKYSSDILKEYVRGMPLNELNKRIPDINRADKTSYLLKARNFVNRLVPELSFALGLFSMTLVEKAKQHGIVKEDIPWDIKALGSCIREGVDSSSKLFHKKNNKLSMRVETHIHYSSNSSNK